MPAIQSDHEAIKIKFDGKPGGSGFSGLNQSVLKNPNYTKIIKKTKIIAYSAVF